MYTSKNGKSLSILISLGSHYLLTIRCYTVLTQDINTGLLTKLNWTFSRPCSRITYWRQEENETKWIIRNFKLPCNVNLSNFLINFELCQQSCFTFIFLEGTLPPKQKLHRYLTTRPWSWHWRRYWKYQFSLDNKHLQ